MSEINNKKSNISFGKLFLSFLLFFIIVIFSVSLNTSAKLIEENENRIESNMAFQLDSVITKTTEEGYVYTNLKKIIDIAQKENIESEKLAQTISDFYFKDKISAKFFFYKNNEFVKGFNYSPSELDFFKEILKYMSYDRNDPAFKEANRKTFKGLQEQFGPGNWLEDLKNHRDLICLFYYKNTQQYYYWNTYDNGLGIFFFTKEIPDFVTRLNVLKKNDNCSRIGGIAKDNKTIVKPDGINENQAMIAFIKSGKTGKSFIDSNDYYWYFQTAINSNKLFIANPINEEQNNFNNWANFIEKISAIFFIFVLILYLTSLLKLPPGKNLVSILDNLSIKFRIIGIFSISSIFPLIMAFIVGFSLLTDKEKVIEEAIISESLAGINNLENQYKVLVNKTIECGKELREAIKHEKLSEDLLKKYLNKYSISSTLVRFEVRDDEINTMLSLDDNQISGSTKVMDIIARITLKLHSPERLNSTKTNISPAELVSEDVLSTDELGLASIIRQRGKIWTFRIGPFPSLWYWDVYPELATGPAFISLSTLPIYGYKEHIKNYLNNSIISSDSFQLYAYINEAFYYPKVLPDKNKNLPQNQLAEIANIAFRTNKVVFRTVEIDGEPFWVTAKQEKSSFSLIFLHLINKKERLKNLNPFKLQLFLGGLFTLIISLSAAMFITRLVIMPIKDLSNGIEAIRFRYKNYNIPIRRKDEFGELAMAFNRVLSEMKDLEQGKIIQDSLFPHSTPSIKGYDIAFFTISASELAGDYHDYVELDDGRISIILGDVSGHGISASLAMAMAKATFNYAKDIKAKFPEELMDLLNTMFNKELKKRNKLMTLISMVLTPQTGEVIFDNAGQSYPGYYSNTTQKSEELKMPSLPLGGMKKRKKKPVTKIMQPGDAFIFFTDGIIEASSEKGEMFGYERFYSIFTEQMKNKVSSKEAIENIYQAVEKFREAGHRSDDISMIIVKKL